MLGRINRELSANFDPRKFTHVVHYDEARGSVDSFLEARERMVVRVTASGHEYTFELGERIHTESSYKFDDDDVAVLAGHAGFRTQSIWRDRRKRFSVHLLVRS